jgi:hypothetical protein
MRINHDDKDALQLLMFANGRALYDDGSEFEGTVRQAIYYLRRVQDPEGAFGPREKEHAFSYSHSICTMAIAEAYWLTGSRGLESSAKKAVDFIAHMQNYDPAQGHLGWRYGVQPGQSDSSVTGWMVLALKAARTAGVDVPDHCWEGAIRFLDDMTDVTPQGYYRTGYNRRASENSRLKGMRKRFEWNHALSAINMFSRFFIADDPNQMRRDPILRDMANQMVEPSGLPVYDPDEHPGKIDYYYWYYASLALFQMGGNHWKQWETEMFKAVTESQRMDGDKTSPTYGSWDAIDPWSGAGGRVYATAINALTLEVYYRYKRLGTSD